MISKVMGEGERIDARRRRSSALAIGAAVAGGAAIVALIILAGDEHRRLAPGGAIGVVAIYVMMAIAGFWWTFRRSDEFEIQANVRAFAAGGAAYMLAYPVWYYLWRGGVLQEPSHIALYFMTSAITLIVVLWQRIIR